ncbi:MAG: helix-turn-helix transcriptional regulator [Eubacteriales bacterium]|nr:helix-turn-helix transcriptional regulator [Eubacteriales bacterium]
MLTSIGRFLRKLRIDEGEILKDMAEKLEVTVSFLSAVENGKKRMPSSWNSRICELYNLTEEQKITFTTAIAETEDAIEMNLIGQNLQNRELAVSFARKFSDIDDDQVEAIKKILLGGKNK